MESRTQNVILWIAQVLLAGLFVFSGAMKLYLPAEQLAGQVELPLWFLRLLGVVEILGGLGLVLPGLFRTGFILVPLAAAGLVIIMLGATVIAFVDGGFVAALIPLVVGGLSAYVALKRWRGMA